ncbi:MAG: hypothetical protein PHI83_09315 [Sphaerochaetaceae bacterium]|jgi:hypothetical protein|nr:hypothetical protein [Sphaerochaetaceae bacterium]
MLHNYFALVRTRGDAIRLSMSLKKQGLVVLRRPAPRTLGADCVESVQFFSASLPALACVQRLFEKMEDGSYLEIDLDS